MTKDEITRPEPGSLPAHISFIEQTDGSAGYYVRFKDVPEDAGGEPERKYIPILQHETQEKALRAAIDYRDRRAEELRLPVEARRGPHTEEAREQTSESQGSSRAPGTGPQPSPTEPGPSTRNLRPCGRAKGASSKCVGA